MKTIIAACAQDLSGSRARVESALCSFSATSWFSMLQLHKCLQLISVLQWLFSFLVMGLLFLLVLIYLCFTVFWPLSALYLTWILLDWDTPEQGGRRSAWVRNWSIWKHFRDYFPIQLMKTHPLLPSRNYIIGCHPHGILCIGAFCNFITESTGFSEKFPGVRPFLATLAGNFRLPILREYMMSGGLCPVTHRAIEYLLSRNGVGNAVVIVVGGAEESLACQPGVTSLILKKRKGFVRMALQHGADLVPSFSFGEKDLFQQVYFPEGSWMQSLQRRFQKLVGVAPCVFYGRGLISAHSKGFIPYSRAVTTVIGEPVTVPKIENPSKETVELYHAMYTRALLKLFHENKTKCGLLETEELHIL